MSDTLGLILFLGIMTLGVYAWWSIKTRRGKGHMMELIIKVIIGKTKPDKDKYVFNNFMFRPYGKQNMAISKEIDHIVVKPCGIYIIETKGWKGKLYGNDTHKKWKLKTKKSEVQVYSPALQSENHVKALLERWQNRVAKGGGKMFYIPPLETLIKKVVVVSAQLDTRFVTSSTNFVYPLKLKKQLNGHRRLNSKQVKMVAEILQEIKETDKVSKAEHIKNVQQYLNTKGGIK